MARPLKDGLDYFSHDVYISEDPKIEIIEAEFGLNGYAIYMKLLEKIYRNGYFIEWDNKQQKVFSRRVNVDINICSRIINDCINEGLFNDLMFKNHDILTSKGIQKRYISATIRRNEIKIIKDYLLLNDKIIKELNKKVVIVDINYMLDGINDNISTQSKGKERKEKGKNKKIYVENSNEFRLAKLLSDLMTVNKPDNIISEKVIKDNYQKWSDDIRKINKIDKRPFDQIEYLINWSQRDSFWLSNILSPSKLRDKFDKLSLEAKEKLQKKNNKKNEKEPHIRSTFKD